MRLVSYINDNNRVYPVIINKSKFKYRLDILIPETYGLTELQNGRAYRQDGIVTSIIYDGYAVIREVFGPMQLFNKIMTGLPQDVLRDFLVELKLDADTPLNETTKLGIYGFNGSVGSSSKIKGISYTKTHQRLLESDTQFYASRELKTLEFFKRTKNIDFDSKDYTCLYTKEAVLEYVNSRNWSERKGAIDTETNDLNFFYNVDKPGEIVGISHSYKSNQGVYVQIRYKGAQLLDPVEVIAWLKPILEADNYYQNGSFDYRVFRRYGYVAKIFRDLMVILQLTNPDPTKHKALKEVARLILKEETIELDEILGANFDARLVEYIDRDLITFYACGDTDKTLTIGEMLYDKLPEVTKKLLEFDMYNYKLVCTADWYGFPADESMLREYYQGTLTDKLNMEQYILDYVYSVAPIIQAKKLMKKFNVPDDKITEQTLIQVMSTKEFNEYLKPKLTGTRQQELELDYPVDRHRVFFQLLGYPALRFTDAGKVAVNKDYYIDLMNMKLSVSSDLVKKDLCTVLEDYDSKGNKIKLLSKDEINTYAFPLGYMFNKYAIVCNKHKIYKRLLSKYSNGRTFETYGFTNVVTGRLSSSVHTIAGYAKGIIGHKPDSNYGMLIFDADQIELRGVHNEAIRMWDSMMELPEIRNNPNNPLHSYSYQRIIDIYNNVESDPHTENAAMFNRIPIKEVTPYLRKLGKAVIFGTTYGAHSRTIAKDEVARAQSEEEREHIYTAYADTKERYYSTNLHLTNYSDTTAREPFNPAPPEQIPFNVTANKVGMTMTRLGRRKFYELDDLSFKEIAHIENQGRNQYIQSYCRDIIFIAISNLAKALESEGFTDEDIRGLLFVHDEEGLEYDKRRFNPLWLIAMVYKHCCIEVLGHKIKYFVTPSIVNNWYEGKQDNYEIPKKMMERLSTNIEDYEILDTLNHRDYVLKCIERYYQDDMLEIFLQYLDMETIDASAIDRETRYNFFKKAAYHNISLNKAMPINDLNVMFNHVANHPEAEKYRNVAILLEGEEYHLSDFITEAKEDSVMEMDIDSFAMFDTEEELEQAEELLSQEDMIHTILNMRNLEDAKKSFAPKTNEFAATSFANVLKEVYAGKVTLILDKTSKGELNADAVKTINRILQEANCETGFDVVYCIQGKSVPANVKIPHKFNLQKFDHFIQSLRKV